MEVLLVKVAQEYHLTDQQTMTTVALPVTSTEVMAVPAGGAVNATPPAEFVSRFPQSYQQLCAGAVPLALLQAKRAAALSFCAFCPLRS